MIKIAKESQELAKPDQGVDTKQLDKLVKFVTEKMETGYGMYIATDFEVKFAATLVNKRRTLAAHLERVQILRQVWWSQFSSPTFVTTARGFCLTVNER